MSVLVQYSSLALQILDDITWALNFCLQNYCLSEHPILLTKVKRSSAFLQRVHKAAVQAVTCKHKD